MASATEQDRVRELQRALYRAAKADPPRGWPNAGGEERRRAVCGRTACTVRGGGGRKPEPVGNAARNWAPPADPTASDATSVRLVCARLPCSPAFREGDLAVRPLGKRPGIADGAGS